MNRPQLLKWFVVMILLAVFGWSTAEIIQRPLWGYLPLLCFFTFWNALVLIFGPNPFKGGDSLRMFLWPMAGGLLLALSFPPVPFPLFAMAGFVPILLIADQQRDKEFKRKWVFAGFHTFMTWNIVATFWVANTAFAAGIFAIVVNSLLMLIPWVLFLSCRDRIGLIKGAIVLISFWLSFEFLHHRWELTWPWLTLGNALSGMPFIAQWYEYTGIAGGTIWILGGNWWLYLSVKRFRTGYKKSALNFLLYRFVPWVILPIAVSSILYFQEETPTENTVRTAVIQPNFEPHYEKFNVPYPEQERSIYQQVEEALEEGAQLVVLPETSLRIRLHDGPSDPTLQTFTQLMKKYPNSQLIAGLNSMYIFEEGEETDPEFLRVHVAADGDTILWESHNSAALIDHRGLVEIYYKSKLVPGAEIFPFRNILFFMEGLVEKLGGSTSGLRTQSNRQAFFVDDLGLAPVICYESIFGEYHQGYFEDGARGILIMTNDGWWDDTPGHIQHLKIGALRAIEYRKEIARAANTGISGYIDEKGRIHQATSYEVSEVVHRDLKLNSRKTFYAKNGDYLNRIALLISIGLILLVPAMEVKKQVDNYGRPSKN